MTRPLALLAVLLVMIAPTLAGAHEYTFGPLRIVHPWARFTPPGAPNGVVYMTIENQGAEPDRLVGASTPRAERVEIHATMKEGEVFSMQPREAIELKPGEAAVFEPAGLHFMLLKLSAPLNEWDSFPLTLRFEKAGEIEIDVRIEAGPSHGPEGEHGAGGHHHD
jgi:copper(I)-binding protein